MTEGSFNTTISPAGGIVRVGGCQIEFKERCFFDTCTVGLKVTTPEHSDHVFPVTPKLTMDLSERPKKHVTLLMPINCVTEKNPPSIKIYKRCSGEWEPAGKKILPKRCEPVKYDVEFESTHLETYVGMSRDLYKKIESDIAFKVVGELREGNEQGCFEAEFRPRHASFPRTRVTVIQFSPMFTRKRAHFEVALQGPDVSSGTFTLQTENMEVDAWKETLLLKVKPMKKCEVHCSVHRANKVHLHSFDYQWIPDSIPGFEKSQVPLYGSEKVYKAQERISKLRIVAVKYMPKNGESEKLMKKMGKMHDHLCVVRYISSGYTTYHPVRDQQVWIYVLMDLCERLCDTEKLREATFENLQIMLLQIVHGLSHVFGEDIKPSEVSLHPNNILIRGNYIKISPISVDDTGFSVENIFRHILSNGPSAGFRKNVLDTDIAEDLIEKLRDYKSLKEVLQHPFFWEADRKLEFCSEFFKFVTPHREGKWKKLLNSLDEFIKRTLPSGWKQAIETLPDNHPVRQACEKKKNQKKENTEIYHLFRLMRNVSVHFKDDPKKEEEYKCFDIPNKKAVWLVFSGLYKGLLCFLHAQLKNEREATNREDLKKFFEKSPNKPLNK